MAVVLIEGFDHASVSLWTQKGWSSNPASMQTGRFAGQAARLGGGLEIAKTLPASYATVIAGAAVRLIALSSGTDFLKLQVGGSTVATLSPNGSGQIQVKNGAGTVIATGAAAIVANSWFFVELKLFINGASGTCEVRLNGVSEIASTVGNFGSSNINTLRFTGNASLVDIDDVYVADTSGSAPRNTFLGDVRVATIMPSADGAHTDWTPSAAGSHFSKVNELSGTFPDGDTTYVSDATVGHLDSYACDDIDSGATVLAVQTNLYARKDDANVRQIADVVRQGGVDYAGSTVTLSSSYAFFSQIHNQDPAGSDWTAANVNADEFGVKVIA